MRWGSALWIVLAGDSSDAGRGQAGGIALVVCVALAVIFLFFLLRPNVARRRMVLRSRPGSRVLTAMRSMELVASLFRVRPELRNLDGGQPLTYYFSVSIDDTGIVFWSGERDEVKIVATFNWFEIVTVSATSPTESPALGIQARVDEQTVRLLISVRSDSFGGLAGMPRAQLDAVASDAESRRIRAADLPT